MRRDKRVKIVKTKQSSKINFLWYKHVWHKPMEVDFENEKTGLRRVGKSLSKKNIYIYKKIASYFTGILQTMTH